MVKKILLLFLLAGLSLTACIGPLDELHEGVGGSARSYDPSDSVFTLARAKDDIVTYRKFIHNHPNSRHISAAINRLGEMLVEAGNKDALETYAKSFPQYQHKVATILDEIHLIERVNHHMNEDEALQKDSSKLKIRRGELFYAQHYFKAFLRMEEAQGMGAIYEVRVDKHVHPDFITVELMPGVSFAMEESFHAMTNIRYKLMVSQSAPLGKYKVEITFGSYRKEENQWKRKDGSGVVHEIEVLDNKITGPAELRCDFRAVSYFNEKAAEADQTLRRLRPPLIPDFGNHYMYAYNLAEYTVRVEKYRTFQGIATYHLQLATQSADPAISQAATEHLQQVNSKYPVAMEFIPYEVGY